MADKYAVNYNDEKLVDIQKEQTQKETELANTYNNMINNTDQFYNKQIEASKEWADKQTEIQQANTDFMVEKIEQQKEQANKDYIKEQKGAYTDYQKQINDYGVNAEQMAASGLNNTGYSETSKVSMYNTYQNRVATAKENLNKIMIDFNNGIKEAMLNNSSKLAEIAYNSLQTQMKLALEGFQYKNTLIQTKQDKLAENGDRYNQRYQQMLSQINSELNRKMEYDTWKTEFDTKNAQWDKEFNAQQKQWQKEYDAQQRQWAQEYALKQKQYQLQAAQAAREKEAYTVKKQTTKLSKKGEEVWKNMGWLVQNNPTETMKNKARSGFARLYNSNVITEDDLRIISNRLGL